MYKIWFGLVFAVMVVNPASAQDYRKNVAERVKASEQSKEVEFRELIAKYLKAEGCDRRFGGFGKRKNSFLVRAKEVARNLPDPVVEEIWKSTRLENFTSYTLPPGEYDCDMLR